MILVAGGTGRLGTHLVPLLLARGERVRILSRDPRASVLPGCELSVGDVRDAGSVRAAVAGVDAVVSAVHGFTGGWRAGPERIDHRGNVHLIDAAAAAGVRRFVLVSVAGARADNPMPLHRAKYAAERHLTTSRLDWTIVRPSAFLETWLMVIGNERGPALVFGDANNPINFVSVVDVAEMIDRLLPDPESHGRIVEVAGPQNLTMHDIARALGADEVRRIPRLGLRLMQHAARPFAPAFARQAGAALVMDTRDMSCELTPESSRRRSLADLLARNDRGGETVPRPT